MVFLQKKGVVHYRYGLLTFKVHIFFLLVHIRFLTFTINTPFLNFPSPALILLDQPTLLLRTSVYLALRSTSGVHV